MNNRLRNTCLQHPIQSSKPNLVYSSPIPKKTSQLYLTQTHYDSYEQQINHHHKQLNTYIINLDQKIQRLIQTNQAQILLAYRNHLVKIKQEIQEFKFQQMNKMKGQFSLLGKVRKMESQIILLRQQALKLFDLVGQKDQIIGKMKFKIQQIVSQKNHLSNLVKSLTKDLKNTTIQNHNDHSQQLQDNRCHFMTQTFNKTSLKSTLGMTSYKKSINRAKKMQDKTLSSLMKSNHQLFQDVNRSLKKQKQRSNNISKTQFLDATHVKARGGERFVTFSSNNNPFLEKFIMKLEQFEPEVKQKIAKMAKQTCEQVENIKCLPSFIQKFQPKQFVKTQSIQRRSKSNNIQKTQSSFFKRKSTLKDYTESGFLLKNRKQSQKKSLSQYFLQCIQIVRQQILLRRTIKLKTPLYNSIDHISLEQFKKIDFFRLLELFIFNDQIIELIHQNTFL